MSVLVGGTVLWVSPRSDCKMIRKSVMILVNAELQSVKNVVTLFSSCSRWFSAMWSLRTIVSSIRSLCQGPGDSRRKMVDRSRYGSGSSVPGACCPGWCSDGGRWWSGFSFFSDQKFTCWYLSWSGVISSSFRYLDQISTNRTYLHVLQVLRVPPAVQNHVRRVSGRLLWTVDCLCVEPCDGLETDEGSSKPMNEWMNGYVPETNSDIWWTKPAENQTCIIN